MIKKILNFIFCLNLVLVFFVMFFLSENKQLISHTSLAYYIEEGDILNVKASYILNTYEEIPLVEKLGNTATSIGIPEEVITDILDSEELKQVLGYFFSQSLNKYYEDVNLPDEALDLMIESALKSSENHLSVTMSDGELTAKVNDFYYEIKGLMLEQIDIIGNSKILQYWQLSLNYDFSYMYFLILINLIVLAVVNKGVVKVLKYLGITLIICGVIYVLLSSLSPILKQFLLNELQGTQALLSPLITNLLTSWFLAGVTISFIGVFILIVYNVIYRLSAKL